MQVDATLFASLDGSASAGAASTCAASALVTGGAGIDVAAGDHGCRLRLFCS